ncbi:M16 family metallopeptidase [Nakamurella flava]|nr:insulinase family protein [Nakamurella flava]
MTTSSPVRYRLANGLRVVLDPDHRRGRVAVGLTVGVGFRHERPGQEGLAHLVEHLFFEGSAAVPAGAFRAPVHRVGGLVNGTTHPDYTEFHQVAPPSALEGLLFADADRLRAPVVTAATLTDQLTVVVDEIRQATGDHRYGGLPWPRLPPVLFDDFADAHDGYGDPRQLLRTSVSDCRAFLREHYTAANTVLTVSGAFDPAETRRVIDGFFGELPGRPPAPAPAPAGPRRTADQWRYDTGPLGPIPGVAAAGLVLPDRTVTGQDIAHYAATLTVCRALGHRHPDRSTGLGFFGPLDVSGPEVLVVTGPLSRGDTGPRWLRTVRTTLSDWSADGIPDEARQAAARAARDDLLGAADDLTERTRALGRTELLFDRPTLVDELPAAVAAVSRSDFAAAAAALAAAPAGGIELRPASAARPIPTVVTSPTPARPRPADPPGFPAAPADTGFQVPTRTLTDDNGLRVVLLPGAARPDRDAPVHLAARWPWGETGWARPGAVDETIAHLRSVLPATVQAGTDGQWLTLSAAGPVTDVPGWLEAIGSALRCESGSRPGATGVVPLPRSPSWLADDMQRVLTLGSGPVEPAAAVDPGDVLAGLGAGSVVLTGPTGSNLPAGWFAALLALRRPPHAPAAGGPRWAPGPPGIHPVPVPGADRVHVALTAWIGPHHGPRTGTDEAAAYLATAIFGSWFDSRLVRRGRTNGWTPLFGRDVLLDRPRVFLRTEVDPTQVRTVLSDLAGECRALSDDPFSADEITRARQFCRGQLRSVADSPAGLAAAVVGGLAAGRPVPWLEELDAGLATVPADEIRDRAAELFRFERFGGVVLGAVAADRAVKSVR